jgi:hypothetical protein
MQCERGNPSIFGPQREELGGEGKQVRSERRKSEQEIESKGKDVVAGMKRREVGGMFERRSTVHARM